MLTWFHPLMDARGAQNLVAHLNHADRHEGEIAWDGASPAVVPDRDRRTLRERGRIAGESLAYMRTLAPVPPVSPGDDAAPDGTSLLRAGELRGPDTGDQRATREISWRLALVGKAMAELWRQRGLPDVPFLLPISVDLRPKGNPGRRSETSSRFTSRGFAHPTPGDVPALARALRRQMADAVRDGQIEANAVAMEFLRYRPLSTMLRVLPWTAGGELFSFNCADLADWPAALEQCFGRRVVNAYHIPVVPPRPGIGVFFNRCGSRNNIVVSWIEGVVSRERGGANHRGRSATGMGWTTVAMNDGARPPGPLRIAIVGAGPRGPRSRSSSPVSRPTSRSSTMDGVRSCWSGSRSCPPWSRSCVVSASRRRRRPSADVKPGVSFIWSPTDRVSITFDRFAPAVFPYAYNIPRPRFDDALLARAIASGAAPRARARPAARGDRAADGHGAGPRSRNPGDGTGAR